MKLVIVIYEMPYLTDWLLDEILDFVEESNPTPLIDTMFFENMARVEFIYEEGEDLSDFALLIKLSFDDVDVFLT